MQIIKQSQIDNKDVNDAHKHLTIASYQVNICFKWYRFGT